jgi:hypothetical protein
VASNGGRARLALIEWGGCPRAVRYAACSWCCKDMDSLGWRIRRTLIVALSPRYRTQLFFRLSADIAYALSLRLPGYEIACTLGSVFPRVARRLAKTGSAATNPPATIADLIGFNDSLLRMPPIMTLHSWNL